MAQGSVLYYTVCYQTVLLYSMLPDSVTIQCVTRQCYYTVLLYSGTIQYVTRQCVTWQCYYTVCYHTTFLYCVSSIPWKIL